MHRIDALRDLEASPCLMQVGELLRDGVISTQDARVIAIPYLEKYPDSVIDILDSDILNTEEKRHYAMQAVICDAHIGILFREKGVLSAEEVKPYALGYLLLCPWVLEDFSGIVNKEEFDLHIVKQRLAELLATYGSAVVEQALGELNG